MKTADSESSSSEEMPAPQRDVCDSWWSMLWCHGTDEEGAVDHEAMADTARLLSPPIPDFPDLGKRMNLQSLKKKIEVRWQILFFVRPFLFFLFFL